MADDESSLERRRAKRVPVTLTVEVRDARGFSLHAARDLSAGGIFFDRAIPHPVGALVKLKFTLPGDVEAISCDGEVVNVPDKQSYGMGIRFSNLNRGDYARLEAFTHAD